MKSSLRGKLLKRGNSLAEEDFTALDQRWQPQTCSEKEAMLREVQLEASDFVSVRATGDEIVQYLLDEFEAMPYILSPSERLQLKSNVIASHFSHMLNLPPMPKIEADGDAWILLAETSRKLIERAARDIPDEQLGLRFASVMLPYNEHTVDYYEARMLERENLIETYESYCLKNGVDYKAELLDYAAVIWLDIECSTGYMTWRNASESLVQDMVLWQKLTQEDLQEKNEHFYAYLRAKANRLASP